MKTKFVEATQAIDGGFNHGKFMVARFDDAEWHRPTQLGPIMTPLLHRTGWTKRHVLVFDLQTGEGALFLPGGSPAADLKKHKVWVCPMFEPFLEWMYWQSRQDPAWFDRLPELVEIPDAEPNMYGYRRAGE